MTLLVTVVVVREIVLVKVETGIIVDLPVVVIRVEGQSPTEGLQVGMEIKYKDHARRSGRKMLLFRRSPLEIQATIIISLLPSRML